AEPPPAVPTPPRARGPWYLRLGCGMGGATVRTGGRGMGFSPPNANVPIPMAFVAGLGMAVGDHVAVGGEWSWSYSAHSFDPDRVDLHDRDLRLWHLAAVATAHPIDQRRPDWPDVPLAPRGPYVRAGLAAAFLDSQPDLSYAPAGSAPWHARGVGVIAGGGWGWRIAERTDWAFDVSLDLTLDFFGATSDPTSPSRAVGFQIDFGANLF
ncbi:MAG TPA: hypothetical protein VLT61_10885, partial [Anaeromyxobacteraceae bacterium]|nr:hypothetical protein [Anaeromyxobacteraceae bacterium]